VFRVIKSQHIGVTARSSCVEVVMALETPDKLTVGDDGRGRQQHIDRRSVTTEGAPACKHAERHDGSKRAPDEARPHRSHHGCTPAPRGIPKGRCADVATGRGEAMPDRKVTVDRALVGIFCIRSITDVLRPFDAPPHA